MSARLRDKQAAYLAAMGREAPEDPRGPTVVELRPPGVDDLDEVMIAYNDTHKTTVHVRGKTTRRIVMDLCRDLGRPPAQVIATATKQGDFHSAWIKTNDGPDDAAQGGQRLAFVTGLTPTVINIVLGHRIDRVEQVMGRFYSLGSMQLAQAKAALTGGEAPVEAIEGDDLVDADDLPEPDLSGDDDQ